LLSLGIIGLPNVGKSSLFKALTNLEVEIANYPFSTTSFNQGRVVVKDNRLPQISFLTKPQEIIPATIEFIDIAGLVKGAHRGEGLGNRFLSYIREVQAVIHVIKCFGPEINPVEEVEIVNLELTMADLETITRRLGKIKNAAKSGNRESQDEFRFLSRIKQELEKGTLIRNLSLSPEEREKLFSYHLLSNKPTLYLANIDEAQLNRPFEKPLIKDLFSYLSQRGEKLLPFCAKWEQELNELEEEERKFFLEEWRVKKRGIYSLVEESYQLLNLITFFTVEHQKLQAWPVKKGTSAHQAAFKIHSQIGQGFICAEVVPFSVLSQIKHWEELKEKGYLKTEGKDYLIQDGDIITFKFRSS
jgi:hypothetical protein